MNFEYGGNVYKLNPGFDRLELIELIEDDYDKFENEFDMTPDNCHTRQDNKAQTQETKLEPNNAKAKTKLELEDNEIRIDDKELSDITSMFQDDKSLSAAFHEVVNRQHLIVKIYENVISCPLCKHSNIN